jgi:hypothetical protein
MQKTLGFFQNLFESINIYKMLLVYSPSYDIDTLITLLEKNDFPISKTSPDQRIYALDNFTSTTSLKDITCILCTDSHVYDTTRRVLKNRNVENMILFSLE